MPTRSRFIGSGAWDGATASPSRSAERSLAILALGAVVAFLWFARHLLLPAVLAMFVAFTVNPLVVWLERRKVPRSVAALTATVIAVVAVAGVFAVLYDRLNAFWQELPAYEDRFHAAYQALAHKFTQLQQHGENIVQEPLGGKVQEGVPWGVLILGTAQGALALAGEAAIAVFTLYFALAEGPRFREKLLAAFGRDAPARERAIAALDEIHRNMQHYIANRVLLNAGLGAVTWGVYALYGLEHGAVWGLTTALLHFVPYVGPAVGFALPTAMAFIQYGTARDVALVAGIYVGLVSIQGNVVDPIVLGKRFRLSSIVVFLGSLLWFLIWGPVGLLLAVPLLSLIRIACARIARCQMLSDLLGE